MLNQQEERPLSIGSAVQFTHKGETIPGHLLQRQGRRRFAKVIDTEERIWKVPESALKHSGGTRRATMVTRHVRPRWARIKSSLALVCDQPGKSGCRTRSIRFICPQGSLSEYF